MPLASIVGWSGVAVGTATTLAQLVRVRQRGTDGVNATTWSLFTLMSAFWLSYGLAASSLEVIVANVVGAPFLIALLARLDGDARRRGLAQGLAAVTVTTWLPMALFGWNAGLVGVGVLIVATRLPQLVRLLRASHARGVSTASWALGSLNVALWLAYYASSSMPAAAASMIFALVANVSIVLLAVARHRGRPIGSIVPRRHPALAFA
ncbi:MAG TPA: hypothetical protein VIE15_03345 [Acidimicrobiales bacterium]